MTPIIHTIGHSDRSFGAFVEVLKAHAIDTLIDVRIVPKSRRHPQFSEDHLFIQLTLEGIGYLQEGRALGGRREPRPNSVHIAIRDASFRGYADHMESRAFAAGVDRVWAQAEQVRVALLCAERDPSHCHRALLSDFLSHRGAEVRHIVDAEDVHAHVSSPLLRVHDDRLVYDRGTTPSLFPPPPTGGVR